MIKGAIIGAGKIAETGHYPAYLSEALVGKIEIVALADVSEERPFRGKRVLSKRSIYNSFDDLLSFEQLDFIDICVPPHLHKAIIKKCAAKNLHILCEKPLAHNIDDAQIIKHQLQYKEIVYMPCHQYKYAPVWKLFNEYAKKINDTKMYLQFDVIRLKADSGFDSSNPNWRTNNGAISGGGITVDTGAHYFYLILEMLGLPKSVFANMTRLKHFEYRVEDTSLVQITSEKGIAQVNLTWAWEQTF